MTDDAYTSRASIGPLIFKRLPPDPCKAEPAADGEGLITRKRWPRVADMPVYRAAGPNRPERAEP